MSHYLCLIEEYLNILLVFFCFFPCLNSYSEIQSKAVCIDSDWPSGHLSYCENVTDEIAQQLILGKKNATEGQRFLYETCLLVSHQVRFKTAIDRLVILQVNTKDTSAPSPSSMARDIYVASPTESPRPETNESVIETL